MKILNREITVANKFIFYYANFVEKIYGYVLRRDGRSIPEENYVGRLKEMPGLGSGLGSHRIRTLANSNFHRQGDPLHLDIAVKDRWIGIPEKGEIVLCPYRKHFLVGCFQEAMRKRRYSLITEDHRSVIVRSNSVIYLTGVSVSSDHKVLQTLASSVRWQSAILSN